MNTSQEKVLLITRSEEDESIWLFGINRPDVRNAFNYELSQAIANALIEFDKDEKSKVGIIYGIGRCFCAGADLKDIAKNENSLNIKPVEDLNDGVSYDKTGPMGFSRLVLRKPVIAAIEGFAVAGGLELACWFDLRVVAEDAIFGVFCRRWGVPLIDGGTVRLPKLIGMSNALDMIITGRPVNSQEAQRMGLANRVVSPGKTLPESIKIALALTHFPQNCMLSDRMSAITNVSKSHKQSLKNEFEFGSQLLIEATKGAKVFEFEKKGRGGSYNIRKPKL